MKVGEKWRAGCVCEGRQRFWKPSECVSRRREGAPVPDTPPPQGSKKMTVMATLDLAPNNISRRDRSQKGQRRERRNWGAVSEGVGGQETFSRRWGDQRIGS